jgi:hypothetical protein
MDFLIWLWAALPVILAVIALALVALNVYAFTQHTHYHHGHKAGYAKGRVVGQKRGHRRGYHEGHAAGLAEGDAAGREAAYLENETFIQCPECDHAIHIPVHVIVEGDTIRAEADDTALRLHMQNHTGQITRDGEAAPREL